MGKHAPEESLAGSTTDQKQNDDDNIDIDALLNEAQAIMDNPDAYLVKEDAVEVLA